MEAPNNDDALVRSLYGVFRIPNESYIVTIKLRVIYKWIEPQAGAETLAELKRLRSELKRMSNQRKIDMLYRIAEHDMLQKSGRYAPQGVRVPQNRQTYIAGWLPW